MLEPLKTFCRVADLGWALARIGFTVSTNSKPYADKLIIVCPDNSDENGYTPPTCVGVFSEANILALGELIDEWKAARAAELNPKF